MFRNFSINVKRKEEEPPQWRLFVIRTVALKGNGDTKTFRKSPQPTMLAGNIELI
jgi:hypothetical protein